MKKAKKLIPAMAMLMISAILLGTASYAWFTMSREVTANGMNVTVTAPTNLLISTKSDSDFAAEATNTLEGTAAKINPASSIDGSTFYALKNGSSVVADTGVRKTDSVFETATGDTYYKDFVYYVKSEGDSDVTVAIKSFEVTPVNGETNSKAPVRAAVLATTNATSVGTDTVVSANETTPKAIKSVQAEPAGTVKDADLDTVKLATLKTATANTGTAIFTVPTAKTVTVTVRVWYEGEDAACTATNGSNFNFNVKLVLADRTVGE